MLPDSDFRSCDIVITTEEEAYMFGGKALLIESLDENPGVFKGQVLSRLGKEKDVVLVGIDPGKRTGLAIFYGRAKLAFNTFESATAVSSRVGAFARGMPTSELLVRVGNGNRLMSTRIVDALRKEVPTATIELVDESGTSAGSSKMRGVQRDQVAAAKIAYRKGDVVSRSLPRNRG